MSCILSIETSTDVYSVAVSRDGVCIFKREDYSGPNHAVKLGAYVDEALSFIDSHLIPLDGVAVSCGPGPYIGLRIGVPMVKGVCCGRLVELISVPTFESLYVPVLLSEQIQGEDALPCPMLDARRMEAYAQLFDRSLKKIRPIQADVADHETYRSYLDEHLIYLFGNGAEKRLGAINHPNTHFIKGVESLAENMLPLAEKRMMNEQFEDVAYFVPFYLKDFVAKSLKKLLQEHGARCDEASS